jgi:hypothetical protein
MKAIAFTLLLALPLALIAAEVKPGDTPAEVRAALGPPRGQLQMGGRELFYYDRGEVELRSGVVTRVALRSVEEQAALEARRVAEAVRVREEQEIRRARLSAEGDALKARKLSDPSFLAAPLGYQVAFWEDFSRRYSDVPSAEQLNMARARLAEQVAEGRARAVQDQRLAELEARVAEAEARTAEANTGAVYAGGYYPYYHGSRDYHPFSLGRIEYRFYDSPLPYATSPGMPPRQPAYRQESAPFRYGDAEDNFSSDRRYTPQRNYDDQRGSRRHSADFRRY